MRTGQCDCAVKWSRLRGHADRHNARLSGSQGHRRGTHVEGQPRDAGSAMNLSLQAGRDLIGDARLPNSLDVERISPIRDRIAAQVHRSHSRVSLTERHEVLSVSAHVCDIMIDCFLISFDSPAQGISRTRWRNAQAIADPGLDLGAFLIIVPGDKL